MRVAAVQFDSGPSVDENVDRMLACVDAAAADGADLVVLPEVWNVGYFSFDGYEAGAEPVDGPTVGRLADAAASHGIYLHAGSVVERDDGSLYNTSALLSPDGEVLDAYRKVHLFGYGSRERALLSPGGRIVTVETDLGTVGLSTCYDLRFPELYRAMVDDGAVLFLVASAWPAERLDHWRLLTRARAVESQAGLVAANLAGTNAGVDLAGHSVLVGPWGDVLAEAGTDETVLSVDLDLADVERVRAEFPALSDRRLDLVYDLDADAADGRR